MPDVHQHVTNIGLPWPVITTKWFVCLFAEVLPIEVNFLYIFKYIQVSDIIMFV